MMTNASRRFTECRRKHWHPSRGAAEAHLRAMLKMDDGYDGHVYACCWCKGWHVGSQKKHERKVAA